MQIDYNQLARNYAQHRHITPMVLADLIESGGLTSASRVLEVGCGTGNYTAALAELIGCACWGIEPSDQMRAIAQQCIPRAQIQAGQAEQLPFEDAFSCLHLISDEAFQHGIELLETDLAQLGQIPGLTQYLMAWGIKARE